MRLPSDLPRVQFQLPRWAWMTVLALLALALLAPFVSMPERPFDRLQVIGDLQHVEVDEIHRAVEPQLAGGFFAFDVDAARTAVEAFPWVARARVSLLWPGVVAVRIWERQAGAVWNDKGLLDVDAVPFAPPKAEWPDALPALRGPDGSESLVFDTFQRMNEVLGATPFALASLALDPRAEWTATTREGIELRFGASAPQLQLDLLTRTVLPELGDRLEDITHIDLRYTNGFAVGLTEEAQARKQEQP